jgi:hypothetical protein
MSYATETASYTYSTVDIEACVRRFMADIVMIAQSSAAITESVARGYAHDVELLAKKEYLRQVDLTLFSGSVEVCATQYVVNTTAGDLTMSRPGGVMWPRVINPSLRIVLSYTDSYTPTAREALKDKMKNNWVPTSEDTSHSALKSSGNRDYASNGWGMQRKDFSI